MPKHSRHASWVLVLVALSYAPPCAGQEPVPGNDLVRQADALIAGTESRTSEIEAYEADAAGKTGDALQILDRLIIRKRMEQLEAVGQLVDNVREQEAQGLDASTHRALAEAALVRIPPLVHGYIDRFEERIAAAREAEQAASGLARQRLETQIAEDVAQLILMYRALLENGDRTEAMGLDATDQRERLATQLGERAEVSAATLNLFVERRKELSGADAADTEAQEALEAVEERVRLSAKGLKAAADMLDALDRDTSRYRRLLIGAHGELSPDILDSRVAMSFARSWIDGLKAWVAEQGPRIVFKILLFLLILAAFRVVAGIVRRLARKAVVSSRLRLSLLMQETIVSWCSKGVMVLGLLIALSQLGFSLGPLLAGLGIAGFVVGFALQDTLANFASGMMILIYRPYDVGDLIEAGTAFGKVEKMSLVSTTILTLDHQTLVVPNGKIWGDIIRNVTSQTKRRVDMTFGVSYTDDIAKVEQALHAIVAEHDKILDDPEPMIHLHELGDSSINFIVRPWVKTEDYWDVYWDVTREVKLRFDREGISIPFPQRDVHLYQTKAPA